MGEQCLSEQEGMESCWQLLPSAGPVLERAEQYAHKPGTGGGGWGKSCWCQNLWDSSEPWSGLAAPVDFGGVALGLTSCESTPVQCSNNLEI